MTHLQQANEKTFLTTCRPRLPITLTVIVLVYVAELTAGLVNHRPGDQCYHCEYASPTRCDRQLQLITATVYNIHRVRIKRSLQYFRHNFVKYRPIFQNSFTFGISLKFTIKLLLKVPHHLKCVTTLPCEILVSENQRVLCAVVVFLQVKLTKILTCCKQQLHFTRKLCYRKDDRAMHPIHGCPENFRDSLTTPMATIPNIFHGLLFGSTL